MRYNIATVDRYKQRTPTENTHANEKFKKNTFHKFENAIILCRLWVSLEYLLTYILEIYHVKI